ncbi:MAG: hypothetical protein J0I73_12725, partial [Sphingomonas sp.]|uniref:hypothetical protein n=1 Tax=Sphingomonas sp. TaxID=28214 RepID=UPI001AC4E27C
MDLSNLTNLSDLTDPTRGAWRIAMAGSSLFLQVPNKQSINHTSTPLELALAAFAQPRGGTRNEALVHGVGRCHAD